MKLLHFADLHLDAPFAWADARTSAVRRANRRRTLERIVVLARQERVDAVLCGGDLFEQDLISPDTIEFLRRTFADCPCRVILAPGNHDWFGPRSPYARVRWSPNVHVFEDDRLAPLELADGVRLWGVAHRGPVTPRDFFSGFRAEGTAVHLALAHASERAALAWQEEGKQAHAPFDAPELEDAGIDLALLGHYHTPRRDARFAYPGNPDPLTFGEEGERGALLVTIGPDGNLAVEVRSVATSVVHDLVVDVTGARDRDEVASRVRERLEGRSGSVRVTLSGELGLGVQLDHRELAGLGADLDGLQVKAGGLTAAYDLDLLATQPTVRGAFVRDALAKVEGEDLRRRVVLTGLRALDGRDDLEVA